MNKFFGVSVDHTKQVHGNSDQKIPYEKRLEDKYEKVQTTTIDEEVAQHRVNLIDFLKIDTEGFEKEVLYGAKISLLNQKN